MDNFHIGFILNNQAVASFECFYPGFCDIDEVIGEYFVKRKLG